MILSVVDLSHLLLSNLTNGSGTYIDATAGNGYDSLFIATILQDDGRLFSFDISEEAIQNSKLLLTENNINLKNITLINDNHANLGTYLKSQLITAAIFNLGYLPGSNKKIRTNSTDTLAAIDQIIKRLQKKGIIIICSYIGHDAGVENSVIGEYLSKLNTHEFEISKTEMINRENSPILYLVIKRK